ncbi:GNAT family N-acetyltransferase [Caulobacter sp. KR2-114]|uniref:GNAT family N-acetyltransferase n=1 Tax=Caulobacter sp. KR2-114 TaxID=3400912 RepID=UPI003C087FBD
MERLAQHVILPAGPGDARALGEVHVRAWRETYQGLLPETYLAAMRPEIHAVRWRRQLSGDGTGEVVLAVEGAEGLVGYSASSLLQSESRLADAEVFTLYLLKAAQGRGLGGRLLGAAASALAAQGARSAVIWVLSGNRHARGFYAHLGGRVLGERRVRGWGGRLLETAYRWDDIDRLVAER